MSPHLEVFNSSVDKKQYKAVESVVSELTDKELCILREIIIPATNGKNDSYISENIQKASDKYNIEQSKLYSLLTKVGRSIAIQLEYVAQ